VTVMVTSVLVLGTRKDIDWAGWNDERGRMGLVEEHARSTQRHLRTPPRPRRRRTIGGVLAGTEPPAS